MLSIASAVLLAGLVADLQQSARPAADLPAIHTSALPSEAAKAIEEAYAAAAGAPQDAEAIGRLAMVLHAWEQWDPARATYAAAQTLAPRDYRWPHLAGLLETRLGRHEEALKHFRRAAALAPENVPVRLRVAEAMLESGDVDGSARLFAELASEPAAAAAAEYGLGRVAMARGDAAAALQHFDRAVAVYPDFGAAHYGRALAYRRLDRPADAALALERQRQCLPCWPASGDPVAEALAAVREDAVAVLNRGIALARRGRPHEALEAHELALKMDPALMQARVNLITLYAAEGDWARAEAVYKEAAEAGTHRAEAHAAYAQALLSAGRTEEAIPAFRSALKVGPSDPQAWNGLGIALERTGDAAGAQAAYKAAVTHAPALRVARFNYARTLVAAGRLTEAVAELEKLRTPEDSETPRYLFALAAALVRAGNIERGRTEARAALALARRYGQTELAATIERDLALLPSGSNK